MNQNTSKNAGKKPVASKNTPKPEWAPGMPFRPVNYLLMVVGVVVLLIGYLLLSGGGSDDPSQFSDAIFNARRLKVAPITLVIGFVIELFAIMYRPCGKCCKKGEAKEEQPEA